MGIADRWKDLVVRNHGTWRGMVRLALAQADLVTGRLGVWADPDTRAFDRLVFVCLGNINRSAYAAAIAREAGEACASLGLSTATGAPAFRTAQVEAGRRGIDLSTHLATDLEDHERRPADLYLVMEVRHAHRLVAAGIPASSIRMLGLWAAPCRIHIHDPHQCDERYFVTCFNVIESAVRLLLASRGRP